MGEIQLPDREAIGQLIQQKVSTSQKKIMRFELLFLFLTFFFAALHFVLYFAFYTHVVRMGLTSAFWLFESVMVITGLWQWYKVWLLKKMNVETCTPAELIEQSIRFKVITKIRLLAGLVLLIPILGGFLYFLKPILQIHGNLIFNISTDALKI